MKTGTCYLVGEIMVTVDPERTQLWRDLSHLFHDGGRLSLDKLRMHPEGADDLQAIRVAAARVRTTLGEVTATTERSDRLLSEWEPVLREAVEAMLRH